MSNWPLNLGDTEIALLAGALFVGVGLVCALIEHVDTKVTDWRLCRSVRTWLRGSLRRIVGR